MPKVLEMARTQQVEYWRRVKGEENLSAPCPRQWMEIGKGVPRAVEGSYLFPGDEIALELAGLPLEAVRAWAKCWTIRQCPAGFYC